MPSSPQFLMSFARGHAHFRAGRFFEAHEAWEVGWKATAGREKQTLQALIMWATAIHHAKNGNTAGMQKLMASAVAKLDERIAGTPPFAFEPLSDAIVRSWEAAKAGDLSTPVWEPLAEDEAPESVETSHRAHCPYCGEPVQVEIEPELAAGAEYIEDCPVCCRPWTVSVGSDGFKLKHEDE